MLPAVKIPFQKEGVWLVLHLGVLWLLPVTAPFCQLWKTDLSCEAKDSEALPVSCPQFFFWGVFFGIILHFCLRHNSQFVLSYLRALQSQGCTERSAIWELQRRQSINERLGLISKELSRLASLSLPVKRDLHLSLFAPAEEGEEAAGVPHGPRKQRSCPRGMSRSDLEQLARGEEDVVEDLAFSDDD